MPNSSTVVRRIASVMAAGLVAWGIAGMYGFLMSAETSVNADSTPILVQRMVDDGIDAVTPTGDANVRDLDHWGQEDAGPVVFAEAANTGARLTVADIIARNQWVFGIETFAAALLALWPRRRT